VRTDSITSSAPSAASATMETRVQTILGPDWNRGFNAQTTLTILTQKSRTHQAAFGFGIVSIARVIACRLREMAYGIGPPFRKPAARFYRDAER